MAVDVKQRIDETRLEDELLIQWEQEEELRQWNEAQAEIQSKVVNE